MVYSVKVMAYHIGDYLEVRWKSVRTVFNIAERSV